jgi:alpha-tubulin suppressor-like RCC1 family protein
MAARGDLAGGRASTGKLVVAVGGRSRDLARVMVAAAVMATMTASVAAVPAAAQVTATGTGTGTARLFAWGENRGGQLGNGSTTPVSEPSALVFPGTAVRQLVTGSGPSGPGFSAAVLAGGAVDAWGSNVFGQLGDGTVSPHYAPAPVPGLSGVTQVAAGNEFMLAVDSGGSVWGWGFNPEDVLEPAAIEVLTPIRLAGLSDIVQVAAGWGFGLALDKNGSV